MVDLKLKEFNQKMKIGKRKGKLKKVLSYNEETGQKQIGEY